MTIDDATPQKPGTPRVLVVDDPSFDAHAPRGYHPERPERLGAARRAVERAAAGGARVERLEAREATFDEIARAHDAAYVEAFVALDGKQGAIDADTYVAPGSVRAARRAAGGACALVEALLAAPANEARGVALLRPPGHHATRAQAMGFCLLHNAAIAAAHALERGAERVAVVDWDVHHGNGTQDIFWRDPRVLYVSLHQSPLYPGTGRVDDVGEGEGAGFTVNVPLAPGATRAVYDEAFDAVVVPVLERFAPDLVIVSAGFDAHARDPLAAMELDDAAYGSMARALGGVAARSAGGRVALLLEGGYDLGAIEGSLAESIAAIVGQREPEPDVLWSDARPGVVSAEHADEIARARTVTARRWRI
ncbi:MAG TPA: histone deacetylase [Byssovorax sp.]